MQNLTLIDNRKVGQIEFKINVILPRFDLGQRDRQTDKIMHVINKTNLHIILLHEVRWRLRHHHKEDQMECRHRQTDP